MNEKHIMKSIIRQDTFAQGTLKTKGDLHISGTLQGSIIADGTMEVTKEGRVDGDIEIGSAFVEGKISGTLEASQYIHISANSKIEANVIAPKIEIEEGCFLAGSFAITPNKQERNKIKSALKNSKGKPSYQNVHFATKHAEANVIKLVGTFNDWDESKAIELQPSDNETWSVDIKLKPGRYEYLYLIDGSPQIDPDNPDKVTNNYGGDNSVLVVK